MLRIQSATWLWMMLMLASISSYAFAELGWSGRTILLPVMCAILLKGSIIIDHFMGLARVAGPWRGLVIGWLWLVCGLIARTFI